VTFSSQSKLSALVADELSQPVDSRATAMAEAIAALYPGASRAVLFYGSCLRERQLDGLMLDFYLIVSDYRSAYGKSWLAIANRLIPPNVFPFAHDGLSAKYAVLSQADFERLCGAEADNVSVWARFAQPSRLVWIADDEARTAMANAVSAAAPTLLTMALPGVAADRRGDWQAVFDHGFSHTYRAELRAERKGRAASIVDADPEYYRKVFDAAIAEGAIDPGASSSEPAQRANARRWRKLQWRGKWLSVVRLTKASFTFAGGIDYLAWKINRHAGTDIVITPWQRRHPLLAAFMLVPRLMIKRAVG
jgi:hypothetical protein